MGRRPGRFAFRIGHRLPPRVRQAVNAARGIDTPATLPRPPGRRVAVLAPHPDDELLGCGGTVQKHRAAGEPVDVVMVTSGERTASFAGTGLAERRAQREAEARAAAGAVGLAESALHFLRLPEGGIDDAGAAALGAVLRPLAPDLVYAPNPFEGHRDHVATTRLLGQCLAELESVERVALYEVWTTVQPNCVVDVTDEIEAKLEGLRRYASAMEVVDYVHTFRGLAAYRSGHGRHGTGYMEAFLLLERAAFIELLELP
jgi:LmbE family N-acetylglucosaminyl deacetylase